MPPDHEHGKRPNLERLSYGVGGGSASRVTYLFGEAGSGPV
jgi:hypothetical protein